MEEGSWSLGKHLKNWKGIHMYLVVNSSSSHSPSLTFFPLGYVFDFIFMKWTVTGTGSAVGSYGMGWYTHTHIYVYTHIYYPIDLY